MSNLSAADKQKGVAPPELIVITKAYDLAREITARVGKYPRSYRFILGDRTLSTAYDILDILLEAKYSRDKVALIDRANLLLERIRFQIRLAHDERLISIAQYEAAARGIDEVGRLVGGWRKSRKE